MPEKFSFAKRTEWPLETNEVITKFEQLKKKDSRYIDLTESNPSRCGFKFPQQKILQALSQSENLNYHPHPQGIPQARKAICQYYQKKGFLTADQRIFLTASTSESYSFLFKLLFNPDEEVLIAHPSYPLFEILAGIHDVKIIPFNLYYENNGWKIDLKSLESKISEKTKAIILVNPNNPTGSFLSQQELKSINQICKQKNLSIICDEVFNDYIFESDPAKVVSLIGNSDCLTFTLSGISKSLGLPQMKLGWIGMNGPDGLVKDAIGRLEMIADAFLSVNTPAQNALAQWLSCQKEIQDEILGRIKFNYKFIKERADVFTELGCEVLHTEGGWYAVIRLMRVKSEEAWVLEFMEKARVFVHPGYFFDFEAEAFIVVSLLVEFRDFRVGIDRIIELITSQLKAPSTSS